MNFPAVINSVMQYINLLPSSLAQLSPLPVYPLGHGPQMNDATMSIHGTPRKHGLLAHSSIFNEVYKLNN